MTDRPLDAGAALVRLTTAVGARVQTARGASGLTAPQLQVLRLAEAPGVGMSGIAAALATPKSTATSIADQLQALGLAVRDRDPGDGRRQVLRRTDAGTGVLARFDAELDDGVAALLAPLSAAQRARLATLMAKLPGPVAPIPIA